MPRPRSNPYGGCCVTHGVNPEAYLTDVLTKLVNNWPNSRIAELTLGAGLPGTDRRRQTKPTRQALQIVATAHSLTTKPISRFDIMVSISSLEKGASRDRGV
jgi:hypothetical protein